MSYLHEEEKLKWTTARLKWLVLVELMSSLEVMSSDSRSWFVWGYLLYLEEIVGVFYSNLFTFFYNEELEDLSRLDPIVFWKFDTVIYEEILLVYNIPFTAFIWIYFLCID